GLTRDTSRNTGIECHVGLPGRRPEAVSRDRRRSGRVVFQTVGGIGWPEIEEGVHVDLIVKDTEGAAHDQVFSFCRLVGKAKSRSKIVLVTGKDRIDAIALDLDAGGREEHCEVLA